MIVYKPSVGNTRTPVGADTEGNFFGESLGGNILPLVKKQERFPHKVFPAALSSASTWFYPIISDFDFINGTTFYRALYIGASEEEKVNEFIGNVNSSYEVNTSDPSAAALADANFDVDILYEGKFNLLNGGNSLLLETQDDISNVLSNFGWSNSLSINETLRPGEYIKVWIRINVDRNIQLLDFDNFDYTINIHNLSIRVARQTGRLNISKVYTTDLDYDNFRNDFSLRETLPFNFPFPSVIKVITHLDYINVFYFDDDNILNNLIIKKGQNVFGNKYINVKIESLTSDLLFTNDYLYTRFSECITSQTTGYTATPVTGIGFSPSTITNGTTAISGSPEDFLNYKFAIDIYESNKELNNFYIPFNSFVSDTDDDYIEKYGHRMYSWNSSVMMLNFGFINDVLFENVPEGFENVKNILSINDSLEVPVRENHFIKSVTLIDDLFVMLGFEVEDCRITDNITKIEYLWEKDIINGNSNSQQSFLPITESNFLKSPENYSNISSFLNFGDINDINQFTFDAKRRVETLTDSTEVLVMGSPHGNKIHHGYTSVSYDILDRYDDFSSTWSFGVDLKSVATPITTGSTGTTGTESLGTTGIGTTGIGTTGVVFDDEVDFDPEIHYHLYPLTQQSLNSISSVGKIGSFNKNTYKWLDEFIDIFKVHCKHNPFEYALVARYNFYSDRWLIVSKDSEGNDVETQIINSSISFLNDNVITLNSSRVLVFGCGKKYLVNMNLYVNGVEIVNVDTYTENTTDSYVITHNNSRQFSGYISYFEVRNSLQSQGKYYARSMYNIFANTAWAKLENLVENTNSEIGFEEFNYKQSVRLMNLNFDGNDDDMIFPIVLQGNGYRVANTFNENIRRSIFNFSNINTIQPSFAFTYEGLTEKLPWIAQKYDFNKDRMVVWVRLKNWRGQRLNMYISDMRLIRDELLENPYKSDYYGVWHMNGLLKQNVVRYNDQKVFNVGESLVSVKNKNGIFLIQLDKQYMFGINTLYKSNYFDVVYDDINVTRDREESVSLFLRENVKYISPSYMEIRNIDSKFPLLTESKNQTDNGVQ